MSQDLSITLDADVVGLTWSAQLYDDSDPPVAVGSAITTGFSADGSDGDYLWNGTVNTAVGTLVFTANTGLRFEFDLAEASPLVVFTGSAILIQGNGSPDAGGEISFRLDQPAVGTEGVAYSRTAWVATADDDGGIAETFVAGAWYVGRYGRGPEVPFQVPTDGDFQLPAHLSRPTPF